MCWIDYNNLNRQCKQSRDNYILIQIVIIQGLFEFKFIYSNEIHKTKVKSCTKRPRRLDKWPEIAIFLSFKKFICIISK